MRVWIIIRVVVVCLCLFPFFVARGDIILGSDFETPLNNTEAGASRVWITNMGPDGEVRPNSQDSDSLLRRSTDVALRGDYSWRFGLNYSFDYRKYNGGGQALENGLQKPRGEVTWSYHDPEGESARLQNDREYWLGIAYYFPDEFIFDYELNPDGLFQLHKIGDGRHYPPRGEPNHRFSPASIWIKLAGDTATIGLADYFGDEDTADQVDYSFKVTKGEWIQIVLHFKFTRYGEANADDGFFKVYMNENNTPVFSATGANTNPNQTEGYKVTPNIYKYAWHVRAADRDYTGPYSNPQQDYDYAMTNPNPTHDDGKVNAERYFYIDDILLGDENSSILEVAPAWPSSASVELSGRDLFMEQLDAERFRVVWESRSGDEKIEWSKDLIDWVPVRGSIVRGVGHSYLGIGGESVEGEVFYRIAR